MVKQLLVVICGCLFLNQQAFALIDGQLLVGSKSGTFKLGSEEDSISGQQVKLAVHLDPIPLIPVGFGAFMITDTFDVDDDAGSDSATASEFGLEVMAWLPFDLAGFTPYAKLGYTVIGGFVFENAVDLGSGQTADLVYTGSGTHLGLGVKWSPLPLVGILLEADMSTMKLSFDKLDGADNSLVASLPDPEIKSTTILLGVEVGI